MRGSEASNCWLEADQLRADCQILGVPFGGAIRQQFCTHALSSRDLLTLRSSPCALLCAQIQCIHENVCSLSGIRLSSYEAFERSAATRRALVSAIHISGVQLAMMSKQAMFGELE